MKVSVLRETLCYSGMPGLKKQPLLNLLKQTVADKTHPAPQADAVAQIADESVLSGVAIDIELTSPAGTDSRDAEHAEPVPKQARRPLVAHRMRYGLEFRFAEAEGEGMLGEDEAELQTREGSMQEVHKASQAPPGDDCPACLSMKPNHISRPLKFHMNGALKSH